MLHFISKYKRILLPGIMLLTLAMHAHILNRELVGPHVWRQTQTQTVINNFATESLNILEPRVNQPAHTNRLKLMEFPIMQWLFALPQKIFGNHIMISRSLSLLIGLSSILGMYRLGKQLFRNKPLGIITAWTFCFSPLFYYYTINPLPDNMALCCCIWAIYYYFRYYNSGANINLIISAIFLLLATLAKLPYVLYGSVAIAHLFISRKKKKDAAFTPAIIYSIFLLPAIVWYTLAIPTWNGNNVLNGLFHTSNYDQNELLNIITGTLISTLPELLLNYGAVIFLLSAVYYLIKHKAYKDEYVLILITVSLSLLVYYVFEINMISLVHDYYLLPFLPLLFLLVTYGAGRLLSAREKGIRVVASIALFILPATAFMRANSRWNTDKPGFNKVYYEQQETFQHIIPEDALCVVGNDYSTHILLYYLDRKGWVYYHDKINESDLRFYISEGAQYFFTDSEIDQQPSIKQFFKSKIFDKDEVRVYSLKQPEEL